QEARLAEGEHALAALGIAHAGGQLDIAGRGNPAARMHVVGMKPRGAQPHRPAAVEAPAALVPAAQGVGAMADVLEVALNGRGKGDRKSTCLNSSHVSISYA